MPRRASPHQLADRGVWIAPWIGPQGEVVLVAVTSAHRLAAAPVTVPAGADRIAAAEALWDHLEAVDPDRSPARTLRVI